MINADFTVAFTEFVRDVPAQGTKFAPFNDGGVKEAEGIQQIFKRVGVGGGFKPLLLKRQVRTNQGSSNAFGGFFGDFDGTLQHRHWKRLARQRRQPQPKFLVGGVRRDVFHHSFQRRQPGDRQMAILQTHPPPVVNGDRHRFRRQWTLKKELMWSGKNINVVRKKH